MSSGTACQPRVVVTGIGAVTAWGWSVADLWRGLLGECTGISSPRHFDTSGQRTHVAGEVPEPPAGVRERFENWDQLSLADRFAVAAATEALDDAELRRGEPGLGVFFGSSTAGMREGEEYFAQAARVKPGRPALSLLRSHQINGPGDAVARALRASGPVYTVSSACSSGGLAVGEALSALRAGEVEVAIAGGADSLCRLTYSGFNALRAVDERPCRPFRADRAGLSLGEGAGVMVIESLERALARGATLLAELLGAGSSCDAHHMTAPHPQGVGAAQALTRALADARLDADAVTFVNAHGTGTPLNDRAEWNALATVFGERASRLPVTATKGSLGHLLGCAGAVEAVATVQCMLAGQIHPTPGGGALDPDLDLDLVQGEPRRLNDAAVALSTSLAFGGANAALVLARWPQGAAA